MDTPTHAIWQWLPEHRGGPCWELVGLYGSLQRARTVACLAQAKTPGELYAVMKVPATGPVEPPSPETLLARVEADTAAAMREHLERCHGLEVER